MRQMTTLFGRARTYARGPSSLRCTRDMRRSGVHRHRRQRRRELGARRDAELREGAVQVRADRAVREEQALADLAIREPLRRELGDLQLLGGELIACLGHTAPAAFARCAQLPPGLLGPRRGPESIERLARGPQDGTGLGDMAPAPEPLAVPELDPRALERAPG